MASEPKPGWYWVRSPYPDGEECPLERGAGGWSFPGQALLQKSLPNGWTLGPRIEDLLRDAEHWRKEHDEVCAHLAEYEGKLREARRDAETFQASQRWDAANELGWQDIASAPRDGRLVWVYTAARPEERLPSFEGPCAWRADAGFCTDELRPVTRWHPERTQMLRDAEMYRWLRERHSRFIALWWDSNGSRLSANDIDKMVAAEIAREKERADGSH